MTDEILERIKNEFRPETIWKKFHDFLRREDQLIVDEMFHALVTHKEAFAVEDGLGKFEKMVMCMLIEEREKVIEMENTIDELSKNFPVSHGYCELPFDS